MTNVLITGGAGYIGSNLFHQLSKYKNLKIYIIDNLSTGSKKLLGNKKFFFYKKDITNYEELLKIFNKNKFHTIFHFAASLSVPESQKKPKKYLINNVIGTKNLVDLSLRFKVKSFIFSSTCAVYGSSRKKIKENSKKTPTSVYGFSKLIAENYIINSFKLSKTNYAILRYFNVIGANPNFKTGQLSDGNLFKNISKNIVNEKIFVNVYGKNYKTNAGTCIREYIDVNDLANIHKLIFLLCKKKLNKKIIVNCGYNIGYSVLEIIKKFSKVINKNIKIKFKKERPGDVEQIYCDNSKLKKILPQWKQNFSLEKSVINAIKWERYIQRWK